VIESNAGGDHFFQLFRIQLNFDQGRVLASLIRSGLHDISLYVIADGGYLPFRVSRLTALTDKGAA
jgi:hypothetical protein